MFDALAQMTPSPAARDSMPAAAAFTSFPVCGLDGRLRRRHGCRYGSILIGKINDSMRKFASRESDQKVQLKAVQKTALIMAVFAFTYLCQVLRRRRSL